MTDFLEKLGRTMLSYSESDQQCQVERECEGCQEFPSPHSSDLEDNEFDND